MSELAEREGFEPSVQVLACTGFSNTQGSSEPFEKVSTLFLFSTGYKSVDSIRSAWKRFALIVQPLQFHYGEASCRSISSDMRPQVESEIRHRNSIVNFVTLEIVEKFRNTSTVARNLPHLHRRVT